ncbi:hypothetical protein QJS10_CPB18g00880 [Acorus calamus]|uniref:DUF4283 domain-containing protein n=1 Tax=Acorus calamus TaxID=4465 RepID=A0AAV9CPI1_ACOCL|nr:hypothetical protein QJS10_CPB18g00880 [Acorus calamus]
MKSLNRQQPTLFLPPPSPAATVSGRENPSKPGIQEPSPGDRGNGVFEVGESSSIGTNGTKGVTNGRAYAEAIQRLSEAGLTFNVPQEVLRNLRISSDGVYHPNEARLQANRRKWNFTLYGDLAHGFYVFKFSNETDMLAVLLGGPWVIQDHLLCLQRWRDNFDPPTAKIAAYTGTPLRVETTVEEFGRCRYARALVEASPPKEAGTTSIRENLQSSPESTLSQTTSAKEEQEQWQVVPPRRRPRHPKIVKEDDNKEKATHIAMGEKQVSRPIKQQASGKSDTSKVVILKTQEQRTTSGEKSIVSQATTKHLQENRGIRPLASPIVYPTKKLSLPQSELAEKQIQIEKGKQSTSQTQQKNETQVLDKVRNAVERVSKKRSLNLEEDIQNLNTNRGLQGDPRRMKGLIIGLLNHITVHGQKRSLKKQTNKVTQP